MTGQDDSTGLHRPIKYRPDIDGLRAVAVTAVVAFHAGLGCRGGFVGVDVFFVISGYLIGSLVYKEIRGHSFSLARFYSRRAKRILPALFGVLLFSYAAALLLLSPHEMKKFGEGALATIGSSSNILFWRTYGDYFGPNSDLNPLLMTWTLGVEEQFYILLPLLFLLLRKAPWKAQFSWIGGLAALSFAASVRGTAHNPGMTFYLLPTRAWELGAGVLLAMFEVGRRDAKRLLPAAMAHGLSVVGLVLIGIAVFTLDSGTRFPGYAALLPVVGAVLIIAARQGVVNRLLSLRPLVFIGLVSYSWYLWHWPLLSFARIASDIGTSKAVGCIIALVSFGCAVLSYKFVEQPFRKSRTPAKPLLLRYGTAAFVMLLVPLVFSVTQGLPQRNRTVQRMEAAPDQYFAADPCLITGGRVHPLLKAPCVPPGPGPTVALMGDSHAGAVAGALRTIAARSGYGLVELNKEDCPALAGVSPFYAYSPLNARDCSRYNRERLNYVMHDSRIHAVVLVAFWSHALRHWTRGERYVADGQDGRAVSESESQEFLQLGLDRLVQELERSGKTVYLVQDSPLFAFDPLQHMRTRMIGPRRVLARLLASSTLRYPDGVAPDTVLPGDREARAILTHVARANPGVHLFDLRKGLCTREGCRFAEGNSCLYVDSGHMDGLGAQIALADFHLP